jgi:hypothetical protein
VPIDPEQNSFIKFETKSERFAWLLIASVVAAAIAVLYYQGRLWWCLAGDYTPWSWDIWSAHNSQHVVDPYSFTHVLHGILEYWILGLLFPRVPLIWRLLLAVSVESSWEIAENSSYVIQRYREETISLNYFGDSIINSISDIACCGLGFVLASKIRFWKSLMLFIATEVVLIFWIHDSLLINILMLIWPIEAIRHWQVGT